MALEISEIGISLRVGSWQDSQATQAPEREGGGEVDREEIVQDCLRRVLQILRTREER